jgi:hypothetical protein
MDRYRERAAILFDLPSGRYGFVAGVRGNLEIEINGAPVTFVGSGAVIEIDKPAANLDLASADLTVSLASHRRVNGTMVKLFEPHLLNSIEDEVWFLRPAIIYRLNFDENRRLLGEPEQLFRRAIFRIQHKRMRGGGRRLEGLLLSPASLAKVVEGKRRGPELQREIDPTDRGYDHIARIATDPIIWGPQQGPLKK